MSLKETIKAITDGTLPDDDQLALLRKLEASILTKKQEKAVEQQKDYVQTAIQTIVNRLKEHERGVKTQIKQIEDFVRVPGPAGLDGKNGKDGRNGLDGQNGRDGHSGSDGRDGVDGQDGVSVEDAYFTADGSLLLVLSDGREVDAGNPMGLSSREAGGTITRVQQASEETLAETFVRYTFEVVSKNLDSIDGVLAYDANDDLITITYANGLLKTLAYDANGDLTSVTLSGTTPEGIMLVKTFSYDANGNLTTFTYS